MKKVDAKKEIIKYILFLIVGVLMVVFYSATTSPLYPYFRFWDWDNALFLVMGKEWLKGNIPYRDLFDQKGPAIFFVNMIGYLLTNNRIGVFIIQVFSAFVSVLFIYKVLVRSIEDKLAIICACLSIFLLSGSYQYGNLVEEYFIPFQIICFYFISDWLSRKTKEMPEHNPLYALFYGITFGFCVMSRLTNAISVCIAVLFIIIYLYINRAWINLLKNAITFILGTAIVIVPFMIYFAIKNSTYDFWYGTILYNISYALGSSNTLGEFIRAVPRQIGSYALIGTGLLLIIKKRHFDGFMYMAVGLGTQLMLFNLQNYPHYSMITFPFIPIVVYELMRLIDKNKDLIRIAGIMLLIGTIVLACYKAGRETIVYVHIFKTYSVARIEEDNNPYKQLCDFFENIPEDERDSVVAYNACPSIYLDKDITPACKFFAYQDWQAEFSSEYTKMLNEEFLLKRPKWILFSGNEDPAIKEEVLDKYYEARFTEMGNDAAGNNKGLILYRRID
jgi:hypothetical protein